MKCFALSSCLQRDLRALLRELVRFGDEVRTNFRPDVGLHGVSAFRSRCVNLWMSGGRGKLAVVLAVLAFCWCLGALPDSDDDADRGGFAHMGGPVWTYGNLEVPRLDRSLAELESEQLKMKCWEKIRVQQNERHDLEMAEVLEMTPAQYRTYKNSGFERGNPHGLGFVPGGDPNLFRDPAGNLHEIDFSGNKYWIDSYGERHRDP